MIKQKQTTPIKEYLNPIEAAVYLGLSPNTLARWRCEKSNLPYCKVGGAIRYKKIDLDTHAESQRVNISSAGK